MSSTESVSNRHVTVPSRAERGICYSPNSHSANNRPAKLRSPVTMEDRRLLPGATR